VGINFWEARAYCFWLTKLGRRTEKIGNDEIIRLPTEFEWEAAVRNQDQNKPFPWGQEWSDEQAHVRTNPLSIRQASSVGVYPSPWKDGPMDMAGNVWEWTDSLFLPFDAVNDEFRDDPDSLSERSVRGSSWYNNPSYAACSARGMDRSYNLFYDVGFRIIKCRSPQ